MFYAVASTSRLSSGPKSVPYNYLLFLIFQVRIVVARLRQSFLETNEEIRSLLRAKAMIEKAHEHTRKDIQLNKDSISAREARPQREKVSK